MALALIHHPVVDKNGQTITAAVTALDLHDIARAAKTYGAEPFYVITPLLDQHDLVDAILDHWVRGLGAQYNPDRKAALALIRTMPSLPEAVADLTEACGARPLTVVTSAQMGGSDLSFAALRDLARGERPLLLLFGTAWGLAPEVIEQADHRLASITGCGDYNHLSVRSAVSIILDRISNRL